MTLTAPVMQYRVADFCVGIVVEDFVALCKSFTVGTFDREGGVEVAIETLRGVASTKLA